MATPKPSEKPTVVTVERNDNLWAIARDYLGDGTKYKQLASLNNIPNPNLIHTGQKIKLYKDASGSTSSSKTTVSNKVDIKQFGVLSTSDNTLFATWTWGKDSQTASYKIAWAYTTVDGVEFIDISSNTVDEEYYAASRQSTYNIPSGAVKVTFRVKPISKTYKKNNKDTTYWEADWSDLQKHTVSTPLETLPAPSIELDGFKLTAELDNLDTIATGVQFQLVRNNTKVVLTTKTVTINAATKYVSYAWPEVVAGCEYKVRCRAIKGNLESDWSNYSNSVSTVPKAPSKIKTCKAIDEETVYLEWAASSSATGYNIEYTTKKEYFDASSEVTSITVEDGTGYYVTNMTSGDEYFFRVRAINAAGESAWSDIVSVVIGTKPAAPTTWSSTTTAIVGEPVTLYWVHNSEDGSSQKYAELKLIIGADENNPGDTYTYTLRDIAIGGEGSLITYSPPDEDNKDGTRSCIFNTASFAEGTKVQWEMRTAGITNQYGEWSTQRTVEINAKPTLQLSVTDIEMRDDGTYVIGDPIETISTFPFCISAVPGPATQLPIGYHLSIVSTEIYETVDSVGNSKTINAGEEVYSKYFDTNYDLKVLMSADNIDLENNVTYTITCVVTMDSGLNAEQSLNISVTWADVQYVPNASISIDEDTYTAYIQPYCEERTLSYRQVSYSSRIYTVTDTVLDFVWGEPVKNAFTTSGEKVYLGVDGDGNEVYFCQIEEAVLVENVTLAVYRREFDGTFTKLAAGIDNSKNTTITDPHPALDYARYRIVSTSTETGAIGFYDLPGYPVGGKAVIIQWNEEWTNFETSNDGVLSQPPWSGSLLKLQYNVDVQDSHSADVSLIEYIGRSHPVSYYGTHLGESSTWNVSIDKSDKETLYALRRLAIWMGDVYVREPSGSGYWAHISVSFNQKHCAVTVPVTLDIRRVEGGV